MLRIFPTVLQVLPSIDFGFTATETAMLVPDCVDSWAGMEIGRIPVSAAAPIEAAWQTTHIGALNGTYEVDVLLSTHQIRPQIESLAQAHPRNVSTSSLLRRSE
jgi:hypothetical protein